MADKLIVRPELEQFPVASGCRGKITGRLIRLGQRTVERSHKRWVSLKGILVMTNRRFVATQQPQRFPLKAKLNRNIPSSTGREDYVPVKIEEKNGESFAATGIFTADLTVLIVSSTRPSTCSEVSSASVAT